MVVEDLRKPTKEELDTCPVFWATSDKEWNPYLTELEENEQSCSLLDSRSRKKNDVAIESHFW